ncbi:GumC family protein [Leptolyngbya cf. ectocarpi LEGE 11479]|uniref:GumC family protein n=1 Tax=Leptolyngbya cf. ectocarpi LEGE 11479 TaxID=1828722 RepID=A0A928ZYC9_LEPEC|nr:GumC family protein [Leptolyngbya ectocarpi]MBE9069691.1 GumC family protein [Leptolyngbya cf. ectocarpi LEGE 11479]
MNFIRNVIDLNLQYLFAATRRGIVPATAAFILTVLGAATVAKLTKPTYLSEGKLLFTPDRAAALTGLEKAEEGGPLKTISFGTQLNSEIEIITSKPLIQKTIDTLQLKDDEGEPLKIEDLWADLAVTVVFQTDVLSFSYLDEDPVIAADVVNTLMELYRSQKLTSTQVDTASAGDFLDRQLPLNAEKVRKAEYELRVFRETYNVVNLADEQGIAVAALNDLRKDQDSVRAELSSLYGIQETLGAQLGLNVSDAIKANTLSQSAQIQDILADLNEVRRLIAVQQVEFTEESPILQRLRAQEASLTSLLDERVRDVAGGSVQESLLQMGAVGELLVEEYAVNNLKTIGLEERLKAVESNAQRYQERIDLFPELEQRQRDLVRNLEAAQKTYQELLGKRQELQVRENQLTNFIQIIEPAVPPEDPSSQVAIQILAMGVVAGFALGLAIIVAIDFFIVDVKGANKVYDPDAYNMPSGL